MRPTLGLDPITGTLVSTIATNLISNLFGSGSSQPSGPSTAEIVAALEKKRQQEAASRNAWLIGLGLAAVGVVAVLVLTSRR